MFRFRKQNIPFGEKRMLKLLSFLLKLCNEEFTNANVNRNHPQLRKFSGMKTRGQENTQGKSLLFPEHLLRPLLESKHRVLEGPLIWTLLIRTGMTDPTQLNEVDLNSTTGKILNQKLVQKSMLTDIFFPTAFCLILKTQGH